MTELTLVMQRADDVPSGEGWLSPREARVLSGLRVAKRRTDWLLGRWTAKRAVARALGWDAGADLRRIEIVAAEDGAPDAIVDGDRDIVRISLSHRDGTAVCLVGPADADLGCDVEAVEQRSAGFVADYFTPSERAVVEWAPQVARAQLVAMIWSAKESTLKALREGLRRDTRSVEVTADGARPQLGWWPFTAFDRITGRCFRGRWAAEGARIVTLVSGSR